MKNDNKVHFKSVDENVPICGNSSYLAKTSDNYIKVDCRRCKERINRLYRESTLNIAAKETLDMVNDYYKDQRTVRIL